MKGEKTDNSFLETKLELRRHFLRKYHANERTSVLDCCQGDGVLWKKLGSEFDVDCWGVDLKPKKGRMKIDSIRLLATPGWRQNVIDVDTYGSPWKHWFALLPNVSGATTVFLTFGHLTVAGGAADKLLLEAMGIGFEKIKIPSSLGAKMCERGVDFCLAEAERHGLQLVEVVEGLPRGNAQYFGVRLKKA